MSHDHSAAGARAQNVRRHVLAVLVTVAALVTTLPGTVGAGATRYATSAAVADAALASGVTPPVTWVATGRDFPDALVAGAAAGRDRGVLVLVDGEDVAGSPEPRESLAAHAATIASVRVAVGTAAMGSGVEQALRALLQASGR